MLHAYIWRSFQTEAAYNPLIFQFYCISQRFMNVLIFWTSTHTHVRMCVWLDNKRLRINKCVLRNEIAKRHNYKTFYSKPLLGPIKTQVIVYNAFKLTTTLYFEQNTFILRICTLYHNMLFTVQRYLKCIFITGILKLIKCTRKAYFSFLKQW